MIGAQSGLHWYAVQTQPHAETKALAHLQRQGFATYLPRYLRRRRHARRVDTVAAPLFPRYLFVAIDMAVQRWRSIRSTVGVSQIVSVGDTPVPVPQKVIDAIRHREDQAGFVRLDTRPRFVAGEKVRILNGVFAESLGLFERVTDSERVAILLDLLGRKVPVVLDAGMITAA